MSEEVAEKVQIVERVADQRFADAVAMAHRYPRNKKEIAKAITSSALATYETALSCVFAVPRDGDFIEGASIRFAEIVVSTWTNCKWGSRIIEELEDWAVAQGVFEDLETNTYVTTEVRRRLVDKNGRRYKTDVVEKTMAAAQSIAVRNAILKGVPQSVWAPIFEKARAKASGGMKNAASRWAKVLKECAARGITEDRVRAFLGIAATKAPEQQHIFRISVILQALVAGELDVDTVFGPTGKQGAAEMAPEDAMKQPIDAQQVKAVTAMMKDDNVRIAVLKHLKVDRIEDIQKGQYGELVATLREMQK